MALDVLVRVALLLQFRLFQLAISQETILFAKGKQPLFVHHQVQQVTYGAMARQQIVLSLIPLEPIMSP